MKKDKQKSKPYKLDLACGNNKGGGQPGFIGIDLTKRGTQADIEHNLLKFPWPFEDNSIDETFCAHFLEHIPHGEDGFNDLLFQFMNELYRILKVGGTATFICPYYTSVRAFQDPTHKRFISEPMFFYFNKQWRKINNLQHYPVTCNFEIIKTDHALSPELQGRSQDAINYAALHYWNVIMDLIVVLKKI